MSSREWIHDRKLFTIAHQGVPVQVDETIFVAGGQLFSQDNPYHLLGRTSGDIGGPFFCESYGSFSEGNVKVAGPLDDYTFEGCMIPNASTNAFPFPAWARQHEMAAMGTTAIARCLPTNSNAGLAVTLGELKREGLPSIIGSDLFKTRAREFRSYGSEYLNVEFGWKPFVSDITKFADSVVRSEKIIAQHRKDHGKRVKRSYSFPVEKEIVYGTPWQTTPLPALASGFYLDNTGEQQTITTTTTKTWFNGCFTYFIPVGDSQLAEIRRFEQEANKLLGTRLTPDTLWNLSPWSWAADWVSNIGDIIHNASAFMNDGLVMHYGYIMRNVRMEELITHSGVTFSNGGSSGTLSMRRFREYKQRYSATPYGFGLNIDTFSTRQQSIIGALGVTKVPGKRIPSYP